MSTAKPIRAQKGLSAAYDSVWDRLHGNVLICGPQSPRGGTVLREKLLDRRVVLIAFAVVFVLIILFVRHLQHKQQAPMDAGARGRGGKDAPVAVAFATASSGEIQVRIPALGTITPLQTVTVRTQISGILQKIDFTEGQLVHQGDLLAQIDPRPFDAAVQQMRGNLRRDQALLADAKLDLQRYDALVKEDSIAAQQLDTQKALVNQYEGAIEADEGQLNTALVNLQFTHIVSPVTGRVGLRQVDQGNYVTPGDANGVVVVNQLEPITALFPIPEDNVTAVVRRLHDGAVLKVEAYDRNSVKLADGKLLTIDNSIDTTTGTIKLRALFANTDGLLFPNQFVNIQLLLDLLQNQIIIPNAATHKGAPKGVLTDFVYVINDDSTVSVRPVTLGTVDGDRVAVSAGLKIGERVVTEGGDRLRDGAPVELPGAPPPPPTATATTTPKRGNRNKPK
ncbi:MAG TPA: efflux RND transporter periplasmic adaptor subunit [Steroidobacteraceae bacterium]|nr:efflux RND transporter periplasmic adaptor subunit [Steroidobacteraceae bacterium]